MLSDYDRFYQALVVLVGPGSVQQRLADAFRSHIQYIDTTRVSDALRYELETMQDELTKVEATGDLDAIAASANQLTDRQAWDMAVQILDMYDKITRANALARWE